MTENTQRVLVVLFGAIGDVARALPLAVRIKEAWPECRLTWAIEPASASLVRGHVSIDRLVLFDRPRGFKAYLEFLKELRAEEYDVALDLQRHLKSGWTTYSSRARRRIGFARHNSREGNWLFQTETILPVDHFSVKTEHFQLFGDQLKIPRLAPLRFGLEASSAEKERLCEVIINNTVGAGSQPGEQVITRDSAGVDSGNPSFDSGRGKSNYVALLIGSTWKSRIWDVESFVEVAKTLSQQFSLVPVIVGGPGDREMAAEIQNRLAPEIAVSNIAGKTSLRELAGVFQLVKIAIGSDSGPMHIASAVGTRVVSIWGPTSAKRSAPFGNEQYTLQSAIGCAPCYLKVCPGLDRLCLRSISPRAVVARVEEILVGA